MDRLPKVAGRQLIVKFFWRNLDGYIRNVWLYYWCFNGIIFSRPFFVSCGPLMQRKIDILRHIYVLFIRDFEKLFLENYKKFPNIIYFIFFKISGIIT